MKNSEQIINQIVLYLFSDPFKDQGGFEDKTKLLCKVGEHALLNKLNLNGPTTPLLTACILSQLAM